jgi:hypothetical protein
MMNINDFNILKVAYNPKLSDRGEKLIKDNLFAAMKELSDNPTEQYNISCILEKLNDKLEPKDLEIITFLKENDIQYIEI